MLEFSVEPSPMVSGRLPVAKAAASGCTTSPPAVIRASSADLLLGALPAESGSSFGVDWSCPFGNRRWATVFGVGYATNTGSGFGMTATNDCGSWCGDVAAILIPYVGNLSDKIGRRPVIIVGCVGRGILGYAYLYFVGQANLVMSFLSAMLMWGVPGGKRGLPGVLPGAVPDQDPG